MALGTVTKEDMLRALATQQGLPFLSREELPSPLPILKNLSSKYLRQYRVCPVAVDGSTLTLATVAPTNPFPLDDLRQSLGLQIRATRGHPRARPRSSWTLRRRSLLTSSLLVSRLWVSDHHGVLSRLGGINASCGVIRQSEGRDVAEIVRSSLRPRLTRTLQ